MPSALRTCSNLRILTLESFNIEVKAEHLEAGLQHLRFAAITPLILSHYFYSNGSSSVNMSSVGHIMLTTCMLCGTGSWRN